MKAYYIKLLEYEHWANAQIIGAIESLETPPEKVLSLMSHILNAQMIWFTRVANDHLVVGVWDLLPVSWLQETAEHSYQKWGSYIRDTEDADFEKVITYQTTTGTTYHTPLGEILTHLSHHAAYHRGQIIALLKSVMLHVPSTDYILWVRE
jgi:uncharacterized damage-inducible protein DinB